MANFTAPSPGRFRLALAVAALVALAVAVAVWVQHTDRPASVKATNVSAVPATVGPTTTVESWPEYSTVTARHELFRPDVLIDVPADPPAHTVDEAAAMFTAAGERHAQVARVEYGMLTSASMPTPRAAYAFLYSGVPCTSTGPAGAQGFCDVVDLIAVDDLTLLGSYWIGRAT